MAKLPPDFVLNTNGDATIPVFVSERTQQIMLSSVDWYQNRDAWEAMPDADWDEVDAAIGEAITEILTESEVENMTGVADAVQRTTALNIAANTPTAIIWTMGGLDLDNPQRFLINFNGYLALSGRIQLTSASAGTKTVLLRRNGTDNLTRLQLPVSGQFFSFTLTWADYVVDTDYIEMIVQCSTASSIVLTEFNAAMSYIGWVQP